MQARMLSHELPGQVPRSFFIPKALAVSYLLLVASAQSLSCGKHAKFVRNRRGFSTSKPVLVNSTRPGRDHRAAEKRYGRLQQAWRAEFSECRFKCSTVSSNITARFLKTRDAVHLGGPLLRSLENPLLRSEESENETSPTEELV